MPTELHPGHAVLRTVLPDTDKRRLFTAHACGLTSPTRLQEFLTCLQHFAGERVVTQDESIAIREFILSI